MSPASPFIFEHPLEPEEVIDREGECDRLLALAAGKHYTRMAAPRRYGKTSLLTKTLTKARADDTLAVMVGLYGITSLTDVAIRIERAYARSLTGDWRRRVADLFKVLGLGLSLGPVGISVQFDRGPRDPLPALHALLDTPHEVASRTAHRAFVVFDEFQDIVKVPALEGILRDHVEHHSRHVSYSFAGSEPGMMELLFGTKGRPLYGQAEAVALPPLADTDVAAYISDRFDRTGRSIGDMTEALLKTARGHPQRTMLLAHRLWEEVPPGGDADPAAWSRALERTDAYTKPEFVATWRGLSANEQRVLRAIAFFNGKPYDQTALRTLGLPRSSAHDALEGLANRAEVVADSGRAAWWFTDPLFERWVLARFDPTNAADPD